MHGEKIGVVKHREDDIPYVERQLIDESPSNNVVFTRIEDIESDAHIESYLPKRTYRYVCQFRQ